MILLKKNITAIPVVHSLLQKSDANTIAAGIIYIIEEYPIPGEPIYCRYVPNKIAIEVASDVTFAEKWYLPFFKVIILMNEPAIGAIPIINGLKKSPRIISTKNGTGRTKHNIIMFIIYNSTALRRINGLYVAYKSAMLLTFIPTSH
jgi:hypothetical protein